MKNKKNTGLRVFSAAAAASMLLSGGAFAFDASGTDIKGSWAEDTLGSYVDKGYLKGYEDGSYKPNQSITRAEYMTLINRVKDFKDDEGKDLASAFSDMKKSEWYYSAVDTALEQSYVKGYEDNTIRPNGTITRVEGFVMVGRLMGITEDGTRDDLKDFADANQVDDWAVPMIGAMVRGGYIKGYDENGGKYLKPKGNLTRAEGVVSIERQVEATKPAEETYTYVTMNVPYDDFYKAEGVTAVDGVDVVTSATKNKAEMNTATGLTAGTYYKANTEKNVDEIRGVVCTVRVNDKDLDKLDASLTANDDYYYTKLDSVPENYKALTINEDGSYSFDKTTAAVDTETLKDVTFTFSTSSNYGDYEMDFAPDVVALIGRAYAATVTTDDGTSYAMRSLENIWNAKNMQLAWSAGFTNTAHGNPLVSDDYVSMMGKTIKSVAFYTTDGKIYSLNCDQYVPVKTDASVKVENTALTAKTVDAALNNLPEDFEAVGTVTKSGKEAAVSYKDGKLTWADDAGLQPGQYTLTLKDAKNKYCDLTTSFELTTDAVVASYEANGVRLVKAADASDEDLSAFLSNISSVSVNGTAYAASGRGAVQIIDENGFIDLTATAFKDMKAGDTYKISVQSTGYAKNLEFDLTIPDKIYAYASLSYGEYWAAEDVYNAANVDSSEEKDSHDELDKGGFDAVSRATTNHGLHRGSFQQTSVIHATDEDGKNIDFEVQSWNDASTAVLSDGSTIEFSRGNITYSVSSGRNTVQKTATMTDYDILGIKYVPVAVSANDYQNFVKAYTVTQNGDTMSGGYTERQLKGYTETANVTANTNGLKEASYADGKWSFGARKTGTDSGILNKKQATAQNIETTVKDYSGQFGEFLRVDMTTTQDATEGGYGELGSAMQTVTWTYYGDDSTYTNAKQSYGTKFAADDWMHGSNGIQLGLTDSLRCQLPADTNGEGYWTVTVHALGYEDYTAKIQVTSDNLPKLVEKMTAEQKQQLTDLVASAKEAAAKDPSNKEALEEHIKEAEALLANADATEPEAAELITELTGMVKTAQDEINARPVVKSGTATVEDVDDDFTSYPITVDVTISNGVVQSIELNANTTIESDNKSYSNNAFNGTTKKGVYYTGIPAQYAGKTVEAAKTLETDVVSGATCSSKAIQAAVRDALSK